MIGERFGRLVVVRCDYEDTSGREVWRCVCDCGNRHTVRLSNLKSGNTTSCGCWQRQEAMERMTTHGRSKTPLYRIWSQMNERCGNPNNDAFADYGGRGVVVCQRWRDSFVDFASDMGIRPVGATIDRVDNARGYEPGNCRWASRATQANNTRANRTLEHNCERMTMAQWSARLGWGDHVIENRLNRNGWTVDRALTTPVRAWTKAAS